MYLITTELSMYLRTQAAEKIDIPIDCRQPNILGLSMKSV